MEKSSIVTEIVVKTSFYLKDVFEIYTQNDKK